MKKALIIFYSYSGHTKNIAQQKAKSQDADLYEIKDQKRPGIVSAYVSGCFRAMRQKEMPIEAVEIDFSRYESITVMAPIWAGHPAPAFNSLIAKLPSGTAVKLYMISGSGQSSKDRVTEFVKSKDCTVTDYIDVKSKSLLS